MRDKKREKGRDRKTDRQINKSSIGEDMLLEISGSVKSINFRQRV